MDHFDPDGPSAADSGIFGLASSEAESKVVLLPAPFEATVSYGSGAVNGPALILNASRQVDLYDLETGKPYEAGIYLRPIDNEILALDRRAKNDRSFVDEAGREVTRLIETQTRALLDADKIVGVIGGDHSVPLGSILAHAERYADLGILHLDAHADLREAYQGHEHSHASIMECVLRRTNITRLVQVGIRDVGARELELIERSAGRVQTWVDPLIARARMRGALYELFQEAVDKLPEHVYLSFDIDGLDPRFCPGTGTPVPGGLDFAEVCVLLEILATSGRRIVGFDLVEVAGTLEDNEWDGNVGARLLYKMIGWTLRSQNLSEHDARSLWERLRAKNFSSRTIA
jgi:agmatinase